MSNYKIKPLDNRLLVKEQEFELKTKHGIVLPDDIKEKYQNAQTEGELVAMGANAFLFLDEKDRPKIGDIVHFEKYDGIGKVYNKVNYRIVADTCINAISKRYIDVDEDLYGEEN